MRVKTSVALPDDLPAKIRRAEQEAADTAILDANPDRLNQEALDVLEYQDLG